VLKQLLKGSALQAFLQFVPVQVDGVELQRAAATKQQVEAAA
jgi:hypothetical protein